MKKTVKLSEVNNTFKESEVDSSPASIMYNSESSSESSSEDERPEPSNVSEQIISTIISQSQKIKELTERNTFLEDRVFRLEAFIRDARKIHPNLIQEIESLYQANNNDTNHQNNNNNEPNTPDSNFESVSDPEWTNSRVKRARKGTCSQDGFLSRKHQRVEATIEKEAVKQISHSYGTRNNKKQ